MLQRLGIFAVLVVALAVTGCGGGDDSSDSTSSSGLYGGPACQDELTSAACIEEVEANADDAIQQGEERLSEEQEQDREEFENEEGVYGSGESEEEYEYADPSETVKPPSHK